MSIGNSRDPASLKPLQAIAIVASCLGLATACGFIGPPPARQPPPPGAALAASTLGLHFGASAVGALSAPQFLRVFNVFGPPDRIPQIEIRLARGSWYIATITCDPEPPQASCTVAVVFAPRAAVVSQESLELRDMNGSGTVLTVLMDGYGVVPVSPTPSH